MSKYSLARRSRLESKESQSTAGCGPPPCTAEGPLTQRLRSSVVATRSKEWLSADPLLAARLALAAHDLAGTPAASRALFGALTVPLRTAWASGLPRGARVDVGPSGPVLAEAQSALSLAEGPRVLLRHAPSGEVLRTRFEAGAVTALAHRPAHDELVVLLAHQGLALLDLTAQTWRKVTLELDATGEALAFGPHGEAAFVGTSRGDVLVLQLAPPAQGLRQRTGEAALVGALLVDPHRACLWAGDAAGTLWRASLRELAEPEATFQRLGSLGEPILSLALSSDGDTLALLTPSRLALGPASALSLETLPASQAHGGPATGLWAAPDGAWWTTGDGPQGVVRWAPDGSALQRLDGAPAASGIAGTAEGPWTAHADGLARAWTPDGGPAWRLPAPVASAPDPDLGSLAEPVFPEQIDGSPVTARCATPAGERLVLGTADGGVHVLDAATGRPTGLTAPALCRDAAGEPEAVAALLPSRDGARVWILPRTGRCWVAPIDGGLPQARPRPCPPAEPGAPVLLAPDGQTALVACGSTVVGLDPWRGEATGRLPRAEGTAVPRAAPAAALTALAVDLRGDVLWTGDAAGGLEAWAPRTGHLLVARLETGLGAVHALDLVDSEAGLRLEVRADGGALALPGDAAAAARQLAGWGLPSLDEVELRGLLEEA